MKQLLILILLSISSTLYAQVPIHINLRDSRQKLVIDTSRYSMTYKFTYYLDTLKKTPFYDKCALEIGNSSSKYYSLIADQMDSTALSDRNSRAVGGGIDPRRGFQKDQIAICDDYHKNYPQKGKLTVSSSIYMQEFVYTEDIPQMSWNIIPDKDTVILGYPCLKAHTKFRGREYYVWFTPDIPLNDGPWKFQGLPGLILNVKESRGFFEWEIVEIKNSSAPIYTYAHDGVKSRKCTREEHLKMLRLTWSDPVALAMSLGRKSHIGGREAKSGDIQYPPVPALELE